MSATTMGAVPADPPAVSGKKFLGFMVMVLGMFMAILDIQIVSASISDIQAGLAASPDEASWIQTSYLIAEIVMIPLSGFLSRLLSTRVLFTISALGFTLFSLACAMANSLEAMIAFRAMQGFLGGAMIPTVFATAFILFPGKQRIRISVLIGLTATLAPTIGPTLGGLLTETFSWHWLFLINVPFGLLVASVVWTIMDIDRGDRSLFDRFDWWGLGFMAVFLGSVEYVMEEGPRWEWLEDETVLLFSVIGTIAGILFFWRALTSREPIVELRAYADRNFAIGSLFAFLVGIGLYGSVYLIPLFLGRIRGFNSLQIGETMFVTGLAMFLAAPIVGQMAQRMNVRIVLLLGLGIMGLALWMTAELTSQSGFPQMAWPLALRGVGTMMVMVPVNQVALGTLPPARLKNASGLYNLMRNLGGAVGLAMINQLVTERGAAHSLHLAEAVSSGRLAATQWLQNATAALTPQLGAAQAQGAALKRLQALVDQQALVLAYNDVLIVMSVLFFLAMPLVFLLRQPRAGAGGGGH